MSVSHPPAWQGGRGASLRHVPGGPLGRCEGHCGGSRERAAAIGRLQSRCQDKHHGSCCAPTCFANSWNRPEPWVVSRACTSASLSLSCSCCARSCSTARLASSKPSGRQNLGVGRRQSGRPRQLGCGARSHREHQRHATLRRDTTNTSPCACPPLPPCSTPSLVPQPPPWHIKPLYMHANPHSLVALISLPLAQPRRVHSDHHRLTARSLCAPHPLQRAGNGHSTGVNAELQGSNENLCSQRRTPSSFVPRYVLMCLLVHP